MSFIKRGAPGLRKRTDRRMTKPPESSPPLATRGVCHGVDTDKSTEIEHTWIHADTDALTQEAHTSRGTSSSDANPSLHTMLKLFCNFKSLCLKKEKCIWRFESAGSGKQTHIPTHPHVCFACRQRSYSQSFSLCQQRACLCARPS